MWFRKNWTKFLIVIMTILLVSSSLSIDVDSTGKELVGNSLKEATVVFGVAKGLNAAISLAQGTEVGFLGLTLSIGEVLDPINDLIEQFSWIILASITSLGIQKILMNFVTGDMFNIILLVFIFIVNIWLFFRFENDTKPRAFIFKIAVVLLFLRFSIPIMSIVNEQVYEHYVKNDYNIEYIKTNIEKSSDEVDAITHETIKKSMFDKEYYSDKIEKYKQIADKASDYIVDLIIAFVFKSIFFPILFLFLLYQLIRNIFNVGK